MDNPGTSARRDGTTIRGFTSALSNSKAMRDEAQKKKERAEKKKEEDLKKAEEERSAAWLAATQERNRELASKTRSQDHLVETYINIPLANRLAGAEACNEVAVKASANTKAGFKFSSEVKKKQVLDFKHCPTPLCSIIDTFADTRHPGNKNPEWPVALDSAFENGASLATLVVEPNQLANIMNDTALSKRGVGKPCAVGASFDSVRMLCTSGGGVIAGGVQWTPSEEADGGLLECYLLPVHASAKAMIEFDEGMRRDHFHRFTERGLACGDGHEFTRFGLVGAPPFLHVTPLSITCDMAAWVERGEHAEPLSKLPDKEAREAADKARDRRGIEEEPFPLALAIAAFLCFRMPMISKLNEESDPAAIWLSAGLATRLPILYAACLKAGKEPFVFLEQEHKLYKALESEFDLYSYFYCPSTAEYFKVPSMHVFTHHRLLDLLVKACLEYPDAYLPIQFLNTHTRHPELRWTSIPGMGNMFTNKHHRAKRSLDGRAQAARYGVQPLRINSLNPIDETLDERGAFLLPMGKNSKEDVSGKVWFSRTFV